MIRHAERVAPLYMARPDLLEHETTSPRRRIFDGPTRVRRVCRPSVSLEIPSRFVIHVWTGAKRLHAEAGRLFPSPGDLHTSTSQYVIRHA